MISKLVNVSVVAKILPSLDADIIVDFVEKYFVVIVLICI